MVPYFRVFHFNGKPRSVFLFPKCILQISVPNRIPYDMEFHGFHDYDMSMSCRGIDFEFSYLIFTILKTVSHFRDLKIISHVSINASFFGFKNYIPFLEFKNHIPILEYLNFCVGYRGMPTPRMTRMTWNSTACRVIRILKTVCQSHVVASKNRCHSEHCSRYVSQKYL